jgi:hypothetical protein
MVILSNRLPFAVSFKENKLGFCAGGLPGASIPPEYEADAIIHTA